MIRIECACFSVNDALAAAGAGADRLELCASYKDGGLFPGEDAIQKVKQCVSIPVYVMIRPRPGNFEYTEEEIQEMIHQIRSARAAGANGFVFGSLLAGEISRAHCEMLIRAADNLPCTFHRAFDMLEDHETGMEQLIRLGFRSVLSSGGASDAVYGRENLRQWLIRYSGRIEIIPGGSIRSGNCEQLLQLPGLHWIHSACVNEAREFVPDELEKLKAACK